MLGLFFLNVESVEKNKAVFSKYIRSIFEVVSRIMGHGGLLRTMEIVLASHPAAPGLNPGILKKVSEYKIDDVVNVNRWHCYLEHWTAEA